MTSPAARHGHRESFADEDGVPVHAPPAPERVGHGRVGHGLLGRRLVDRGRIELRRVGTASPTSVCTADAGAGTAAAEAVAAAAATKAAPSRRQPPAWRLAGGVALCRGLAGLVFAAAFFGAPAALAQAPAEFVPVTDAMLQAPAPGDWLMWRRTFDGWGFRGSGRLSH